MAAWRSSRWWWVIASGTPQCPLTLSLFRLFLVRPPDAEQEKWSTVLIFMAPPSLTQGHQAKASTSPKGTQRLPTQRPAPPRIGDEPACPSGRSHTLAQARMYPTTPQRLAHAVPRIGGDILPRSASSCVCRMTSASLGSSRNWAKRAKLLRMQSARSVSSDTTSSPQFVANVSQPIG